jgi:hypothetical protein
MGRSAELCAAVAAARWDGLGSRHTGQETASRMAGRIKAQRSRQRNPLDQAGSGGKLEPARAGARGCPGPFEVHAGGRSVSITSAKQRALLALLALNAGQVVSADRLIDGLWGESAGADARNALQRHVSRLRKPVGPSLLTRRPAICSTFRQARSTPCTSRSSCAKPAPRYTRAALPRRVPPSRRPSDSGAPLAELVDRDWPGQEAAHLRCRRGGNRGGG